MMTNEELMGPFIKSAQRTFSSMLGLDVQAENISVRENDDDSHASISGIVGLSGDIQGVVVLEYPLATSLTMVSKFIGEEFTEIDDDVADAIGEITNIIAGYAKKDMFGLNVSIGLPTVVEGSDYAVHLAKGTPVLCAAMTSAAGDFIIAVSMKFKEQ
jgi:chemotaxis protein CheX